VRGSRRLAAVSAEAHPLASAPLLDQARALHAAGRGAEAVDACRRLLSQDPRNAEALCVLGNALCGLGGFTDAAQAYRGALAARPDYAEAQHNLGFALQNLGALSDAEAAYRHTLALQPESASALANLGDVLQRLERLEEAEATLRSALRIVPRHADAHNNLGIVLHRLGRETEALASFRRALDCKPDMPQLHNNLANAFVRLGRNPEAEAHFRQSLALAPGDTDVRCRLGIVLQQQGRDDEAESTFRSCIAIAPDHAVAHANLALVLLARSEIAEGFREYEWRLKANYGSVYIGDSRDPAGALPRPSTVLPIAWAGRRVLLLPDQGIGDDLLFLRYAGHLRAAGAYIAHRPAARFAPLVARAGWVDEVVPERILAAPFDNVFASSDLALLAQATEAAPSVRLAALPARVEAMRRRLAQFGPPPWIGVTWRAGTGQLISDTARLLHKEIAPGLLGSALAPLDARIVVLQRSPEAQEAANFATGLGRPALDLAAVNDDLEDVCALLSSLTAYTGVSSTNMHLCAALDRTAHVMLPFPYDWRWMREGSESPWFPGFTLYRQQPDGNWAPALARLRANLSALLTVGARS